MSRTSALRSLRGLRRRRHYPPGRRDWPHVISCSALTAGRSWYDVQSRPLAPTAPDRQPACRPRRSGLVTRRREASCSFDGPIDGSRAACPPLNHGWHGSGPLFANPRPTSNPAWSPDGTKIVFVRAPVSHRDCTSRRRRHRKPPTTVASGRLSRLAADPVHGYPRPQAASPMRVSLARRLRPRTAPKPHPRPPARLALLQPAAAGLSHSRWAP